jgi:hypothetical protein
MAQTRRIDNSLEALVDLLDLVRHSLDYPTKTVIYLDMPDKILDDIVEQLIRESAQP